MLLDTRTWSMKSVTKSLVPHQCIRDPCTHNAVHKNFKSNQHITSVILYACTKEIPTKKYWMHVQKSYQQNIITLSHRDWRSYTSTSPPEENIICSIAPSGWVFSMRTNSSGRGSSTWGSGDVSMTCVVSSFRSLQ